jgi:hypothetical protein
MLLFGKYLPNYKGIYIGFVDDPEILLRFVPPHTPVPPCWEDKVCFEEEL